MPRGPNGNRETGTVLKATIEDIRGIATRCGLDAIGAAPAWPVPVEPATAARLVNRAPKDLGYLAARLQKRLDPGLVLPGVRTVLSAVIGYGSDRPGVEALTPGTGFISRFAWSHDYHVMIGAWMKDLCGQLKREYGAVARWYVDTGPVFEKAYAVAAGHGFVGKNSLLITPRFGSWVFLGTVLTDLDVVAPPSGPTKDGCGKCRDCQDACPTAALEQDYVLDSSRCLAHLTVSDRGPPSPELASRLAGNLYGCDICQDVCPRNIKAVKPGRREFAPLPGLYMPRLDDVLAMDQKRFLSVFGETPVRRRKLGLLQATARLLKR